MVFGHSGHVFRGVQIHRQRPILYCTGNFIDRYAVDEVKRDDESFVWSTDERPTIQVLAFPNLIREFQARMAHDREAEVIAAKMAD